MNRKNVLGAILGVLALGAGILWAVRPSSEMGSGEPLDGVHELGRVAHSRPAPSFELKSSNGQVHRLEDFKGRPVIVHFWASWCPPCLGEIPQWLGLAERWKESRVQFVAVSLDTAWVDALRILPDAKLPSNTVSVLDQSQKLSEEYGTYQYPETYLLDARHRIVAKWVGPQDWNGSEVTSAIERTIPKP